MKNLILLTLDATRKDALSVYDKGKALSPTFEEWAAEALVFTNAQATGPYTQASFPGILTSSHFLDYGLSKRLSSKRTLISEPLHEAGISTAAFHSNPYLCEYLGWNRSWDCFYDSMTEEVDARLAYVRGGQVNRKAFKWLTKHTRTQPNRNFFLWLHYMDVHEPYMPERRFLDLVDPLTDLSEDSMYALFQDVLLKRDTADPDIVATLRRLYDAQVPEIDQYFAELLGCLDDLGILSTTAIIVTSDHGDEFGEHGGLSHDDKMYSELIDVPLIVHGLEECGFCERLVSTIDISPTIVDFFGLPPVHEFQGRSIMPSSDFVERAVYGEATRQHGSDQNPIETDVYYCRDDRMKIIHRPASDSWELYDLESDPAEQTNISDGCAEAEQMKEAIVPRVKRWTR